MRNSYFIGLAQAGDTWKGKSTNSYLVLIADAKNVIALDTTSTGKVKEAYKAYEQFVSKRYSATKTSGNYVYVLTTVKEGKEKGAGLIGVHMETGRGDRQIMFKDKEPDYQVDDAEGRVFNLRNSKELSAFSVDAAPVVAENEKKN